MNELGADNTLFQQDSATAHTVRATILQGKRFKTVKSRILDVCSESQKYPI